MPDRGKLVVEVLDSRTQAPIQGARINVYTKDTPSQETVAQNLPTDISGQTMEITLPAPDFKYSQQPSDVKPYSEYVVEIISEGYREVIVNGVQILPESTAIQQVTLSQREGTRALRQEPDIINIPPNTLYGDYPPKIPEEESKPIPPPTGFVVLDYPQVPEFIIVHDGHPDDPSAPNYWVRYRDYIKNVASSEIYSTWPLPTLYANICCIISFTLNRVFTEWYRGKGKNFTITSSTAFDQKYVHRRNIYESISRVVDDIFNLYIRRPSARQPLLAQYCDGSQVQCPGWLTQWGSKFLGDQGMPFDQILKYFYGTNLEFSNAQVVSGVPQSFPGYTLSIGSSGNPVRTVQTFLNRIARNFPAIPTVRVDGIYGQETAEAVRVFQRVFRLPVTGTVDFATWYRISDIYVAVTKIAELN
ncbi:Peptidoglycan-binding (PGRP) domain of peptidoglycan hydrolases-containing protein [Alkalithermobacter thermoalcaliphilus JW-YL-7 = DSM 7308]|uniref:Peptidoglycan-binding (PGRP) domain of peptidoglycan hydrolases-containing protein n=1 Tax=Alkalithermobacter thermoalcaliphilus JW-YL-7 = DSM 7308 TaxID=1121328 RepID=A0A150FNV9_CLOPD|nr:Peptidoglycan-binding domain 1 protein [[Clostridium] paradoxum JW-YL-7 = DSM 7308]SHK84990.1 Peptidoglycan-binding (PGRP) domain of peptidoglycan hydrolases-containing protein [[Clostridium] paradoxum JW-YL-7 = DSM 7308]